MALVPVVNEPAFHRGERTAEDGLDLARVCPGNLDGSITEQIAYALNETIRSADYYIDLYRGPRVAACGTRSTRLPAAHGAGLWSRRRLGHVSVSGTLPLDCGRCGDSAIYVEYLGAATCDSAGVEAYVQGCVNVMGELVMVEDNSEGAGHMQIQNQSPITGFFEPAVGLGDSLRLGDLLGRVTDMMGDRVEVNALGVVLAESVDTLVTTLPPVYNQPYEHKNRCHRQCRPNRTLRSS